MRVSTAQSYASGIADLQRRQQDLEATQRQMTTGRRVNEASDDPAAAARAERALASQRKSEASQRALDASRNAMTLTESALGDANELMQEVRETVIAAGNGSYSDGERQALAEKLKGLRSQLLSLANRPDGNGGYLFSGQGSSQPPFIDGIAGVTWRGSTGQIEAPSGEVLPLTTDGRAAWLEAPTGNGVFQTSAVPGSATAWISAGSVADPSALTGSGYTLSFGNGGTTYTVLQDGNPTAWTDVPYASGSAIEFDGISVTVTGAPADGDGYAIDPSTPTLSVFDVLDRTIAGVGTPSMNASQISQTVNSALRDVDSVMGRLQWAQSAVGEVLNRADGIEGRLQDSVLEAKTARSNAEDLDMVAAISDFNNKQSGYDAALQAYAQVRRMSLFDYIKT